MSFQPTPDPDEQHETRVSESVVQREIMHLLHDGRPWSNAEIKRALSATLALSPADRVQAKFRPNEEKWEELVNNALSAARGNSLHADFDALGVIPDPSSLYEPSYSRTLRRLVSQVISVEGPIYDDVLAVRIARAHSKDRTGPIIRNLALGAVESRFPRTEEDGRVLFWPEDAILDAPVPYRRSSDGLRAHSDIPFAELASIAMPFIHSGLTEEAVLQMMADTFGLARLRQATRKRFLSAVEIATRFCEI